jgi:hypothetical protein
MTNPPQATAGPTGGQPTASIDVLGPDPSPAADVASERSPAPGELHIKERRTWKTWQLVTGMIVAALFGMFLNHISSNASPSSSSTKGYSLPPPAATGGSASTTVPTTTVPISSTTSPGVTKSHASGKGATASKAKGSSEAVTTTTTVTTSTTTITPSTGPIEQLLLSPQLHGNWTSGPFMVTNPPWSLGWAFACSPAPASGPSFQVFVTPVGGKQSTAPAVNETGASGQQVTSLTSVGNQTLDIEAPATCEWVVKVTGH